MLKKLYDDYQDNGNLAKELLNTYGDSLSKYLSRDSEGKVLSIEPLIFDDYIIDKILDMITDIEYPKDAELKSYADNMILEIVEDVYRKSRFSEILINLFWQQLIKIALSSI